MPVCKKILVVFLILSFLTISCAPQKPKENKIVVWHWMNDRKDAFIELAKRYKEQTGINVEFKLFSPPDIYSQKVIAAARAGNLPEIFGILGEKRTLASFIKAGHILNLTSAMQSNNNTWKQKFYPQTLAVVIFKDDNTYNVTPGIYGVPVDTTVMQFVYNKTLFKEANLDPNNPPDTFDEFIDYAKKIKDTKKISGFVCGWGEGWLLNCLASEWAINLMGEEKFLKTIEGQIPYTDKDWLDVFSLFVKLRDSAILTPNITTMINKESEDAFSKGQAPFSFNGSWSVNVYKQLAADLDYAFFSLPQVSNKFPIKVWGGSGSSFMVNTHSPNKDEAVKFLQWVTSKEQQEFLIKETNNLPAIIGCEDSLSPVLKTLVDDLNNLTHPDVWPYNEDSRVIEVINKGLQQIIMGIKTPEELAKEIQEVKQRVCATR
ncbi:MAG: extracellular solute-binding protein [Candidatus Omnitrophota bacterium]|nr:extracellular solute-binding protein [Candidatus Omnitrophota bacterium]